jgi:hypothetical protein
MLYPGYPAGAGDENWDILIQTHCLLCKAHLKVFMDQVLQLLQQLIHCKACLLCHLLLGYLETAVGQIWVVIYVSD